METTNARELMHKHGFCVVQGMYEPIRMDTLEHAIHLAPADAVKLVMNSGKVRQVVFSLIGDVMLQTGENHVNVGGAVPEYLEMHRDYIWDAVPPSRIIPMYRFALYFRDYSTHSGGLAVSIGSHLLANDAPIDKASLYAVPSQPGDLVIWNCRTLHAAGAVNGELPDAEPRNAIFFDYAAPCGEIDRYVAYRKAKKAGEMAA